MLLLLPKYRIIADYNIVLGRHTELVLQYSHNKDFALPEGGEFFVPTTGESANVVNLRLGVHF